MWPAVSVVYTLVNSLSHTDIVLVFDYRPFSVNHDISSNLRLFVYRPPRPSKPDYSSAHQRFPAKQSSFISEVTSCEPSSSFSNIRSGDDVISSWKNKTTVTIIAQPKSIYHTGSRSTDRGGKPSNMGCWHLPAVCNQRTRPQPGTSKPVNIYIPATRTGEIFTEYNFKRRNTDEIQLPKLEATNASRKSVKREVRYKIRKQEKMVSPSKNPARRSQNEIIDALDNSREVEGQGQRTFKVSVAVWSKERELLKKAVLCRYFLKSWLQCRGDDKNIPSV